MVWSVGILAIVTIFTLLATVAAEGSAAAWGEAKTYLIAFIANAAAIALILAWNFWLAPYELVMEELAKISAVMNGMLVPPEPEPEPKINLNPVKTREIWSVGTLAEVAAALDPLVSGSKSNLRFSYKITVIDAMKSNRLTYIKQPVPGHRGNYYEPSDSTEIKRHDAIEWLEKVLKFDASELK